MLSAWGSRESIPIAAVMGSQFAAIAAVVAFLLFGERLGAHPGRSASSSIVVGVTALAAADRADGAPRLTTGYTPAS